MKTSILFDRSNKMVTKLFPNDFVIYEFPDSPGKRVLGITEYGLTVVLFTSGGLYSQQSIGVFEDMAKREIEVEDVSCVSCVSSDEIPNFNHSCTRWERKKRFKFCEINIVEYGNVLIESISTTTPLMYCPYMIAYNKGIPIGGLYSSRNDLTVFHINEFLNGMSHKLSFDVEENFHKRIIKLDEKKEMQNQIVRILDVHFPADISDIILSYSTDSFKFGSILASTIMYTMLVVDGTPVTLG
jgi:hypothetical protein